METKTFYDSTDNIKLCGLMSKANDNHKIVLLCHGLNGDKTERNSFNMFVEKFFSKEHKDIADMSGWFEVQSIRTGKRFRLGKDLYKEVYQIVPYQSLIKVKLPILFVHGLIDNMVPYELSVKVSGMCENAKLELIENGTHTFDNDINALNNAIDVSIDFIKNVISNDY